MLLGIVGTVSSSGFLQSSILVATATNGLHYSGQYAAALTLTTPVTLIASAIALALFPAMAGDHGRNDLLALNKRTNNATRILITVMIAMFGSISILAEPLTMLVWGREFENTSQILIFLLLAVVLITVAVPSVNSLTTQSNRGMAISAFSSLLGFTVGASTWVCLGGTAPGYSVPAGYLLGAMIISGVPYVLVWRSQRQHWSVQTMVLLGALASVLTITFSVRAADLPDWGLLIAAVLFLVVWCAVRSRDVKQIARLLVDLLGRRGA
jgi:O-antigen/teichoic acid export membrane protein